MIKETCRSHEECLCSPGIVRWKGVAVGEDSNESGGWDRRLVGREDEAGIQRKRLGGRRPLVFDRSGRLEAPWERILLSCFVSVKKKSFEKGGGIDE